MNIHQVSVSYVMEQDRLLMRLNCKEGGELRAWLTRRLALGLMPVLNKTAGEQMTKVALRKGDFETPYQAQAHAPADIPLGPEPLLLTEVKMTLMGNGQLRLEMFEKFAGQDANRNFQIMMDAPLSNGLLKLLHQGLQQSRWLEAPVAQAMATDLAPAGWPATPDPDASDPSADTAKPKYLN